MDAQKLEQIQKVFANDRFATDNGAVIEQVDEGYAKCWLEIQPHHLNAAGTVMGGAIFTLADFAGLAILSPSFWAEILISKILCVWRWGVGVRKCVYFLNNSRGDTLLSTNTPFSH